MDAILKNHADNTHDIVVLQGSFQILYFVGVVENIDHLTKLIHLVTLMGYALVFRKGVREVYVAFFPVVFLELCYIHRDEVFVHKHMNVCHQEEDYSEYRTYLSGRNFKKYMTNVRQFFFFDVSLNENELEISRQQAREYRWKQKRGAFIVAHGILNGRYFHTLKIIANFC